MNHFYKQFGMELSMHKTLWSMPESGYVMFNSKAYALTKEPF